MNQSRRRFIKNSSALLAGAALTHTTFAGNFKTSVPVSGHLWIYASKYSPESGYDCTPVLETIFGDFKYAGIDGLELMEAILRHDDAVQKLLDLSGKYSVPVTGSSYGADMWNKSKHTQILDDVDLITQRLHQAGGKTFGISVGNAGRVKTEDELDAQAALLKDVWKVCKKNKIQPNLHNHTYEVENNMHDLKGTIARIPGIALGPDLNWLVRAGIDPVTFIQTYGHQMVYMHIRDQKADGKWTEAVGDGVINFTAIADALKKVNFKGRAAIELAFDAPPVNPIKDDWKKSRMYVRDTFSW
ncbi:sugar phosphate isomerase/epimerase family protein [Mucilaginibacter gilvus]|uniref:Sugar phosphate isomerase/epimerase n=1 Tax=Mucilaginibacter gilvus TaxID=2305909 RepID=A0A444MVB8_9SPHI|nr:sugar phosphate isomerase/epimerase [Mucilaginibacter gilvus]RWY57517.1 sugar phosphate isomerase/epimerase [Mucilaginibacter gilvus]